MVGSQLRSCLHCSKGSTRGTGRGPTGRGPMASQSRPPPPPLSPPAALTTCSCFMGKPIIRDSNVGGRPLPSSSPPPWPHYHPHHHHHHGHLGVARFDTGPPVHHRPAWPQTPHPLLLQNSELPPLSLDPCSKGMDTVCDLNYSIHCTCCRKRDDFMCVCLPTYLS